MRISPGVVSSSWVNSTYSGLSSTLSGLDSTFLNPIPESQRNIKNRKTKNVQSGTENVAFRDVVFTLILLELTAREYEPLATRQNSRPSSQPLDLSPELENRSPGGSSIVKFAQQKRPCCNKSCWLAYDSVYSVCDPRRERDAVSPTIKEASRKLPKHKQFPSERVWNSWGANWGKGRHVILIIFCWHPRKLSKILGGKNYFFYAKHKQFLSGNARWISRWKIL